MPKKLFLLGALALATTGLVSAQVKVAVIKLQDGLLATAEMKKAQAELQAKYKSRQDALEKLQRELQGIQETLNDPVKSGKYSQSGLQDLQAQGTRKQREGQRLQTDLEEDFNRDRQDILGRAGTRITEIVKKIAEEKGIDVVVEFNNTIYVKPTLDITTEVVAAYDKKYPAK